MIEVDVILFDWGGTLASVARQVEALRRGAEEAAAIVAGEVDGAEVERLTASVLAAEAKSAADPSHREVDLGEVVAAWVRERGEAVSNERIGRALEIVGGNWVGSLDPLPGAVEAVRTLRERGYRMGLVSNCIMPRAACEAELARHGFGELLDFAVFSSVEGYRKPAPRVYQTALEKAFPEGVPGDLSRVLFVGDSPRLDVIEPRRMGMRTALVKSAGGFWPETDHAEARPDVRIDAVAELLELLTSRG